MGPRVGPGLRIKIIGSKMIVQMSVERECGELIVFFFL